MASCDSSPERPMAASCDSSPPMASCDSSPPMASCDSSPERPMAASCDSSPEREGFISLWPSLPPELLRLIEEFLMDIADHVSFRLVCKPWRSATRPNYAPKQLPWLLRPYNSSTTTRSFYSLYTSRTYRFHCAAADVGRVVIGSSFGWLVLIAPDSGISLWNPLTRARIALPSYVGPAAELNNQGDRYGDGYLRPGYPLRVSLSSSPAAPDCVVLVVLSLSSTFAYCRIGDQAWTIREAYRKVNSVVLHNGRFYAVDLFGSCAVLVVDDPLTWSHILFDVGPPLIDTFLMKAADDDHSLYMLHWSMEDKEEEQVTHLNVFKLEVRSWQRLESPWDYSFFLSGNHCSVVRTTDFSNKIYFSQWGARMDDIYVYDINRSRLEPMQCQMGVVADFPSSPTWFMPNLDEI